MTFLVQYLEPGPEVEAADPGTLAATLREALAVLPATDVAIGWGLSPSQLDAVRRAIPARLVVWRWMPVFVTRSGPDGPGPSALGPDRAAPEPFRGMADFRIGCLTQPAVVDDAMARVLALVSEADAAGALLDRIRWPSPSQDPAADLCCFCEACNADAVAQGLDLSTIAAEMAAASGDLPGRRRMVETIFGRHASTPLGRFMAWRAARVTVAVARVVHALRARGLLVGYDVFSPAIAFSVGQDLAGLPRVDLVKAMTYLDAQGPASLPFELAGYGRWLEAMGEPAAADVLADLIGFRLAPNGAAPEVRADILGLEARRLAAAVGEVGVIGLDVVGLPGVLSIADTVVRGRVTAIRRAGVGIAPSWDLRLMSSSRLEAIAAAWAGGASTGTRP